MDSDSTLKAVLCLLHRANDEDVSLAEHREGIEAGRSDIFVDIAFAAGFTSGEEHLQAMARNHYYLSINDLAHSRGADPRFAYDGAGPDDFAAALQESLRGASLFKRWRAAQPDPDAVDHSLAAVDPAATVTARVADLHTEVDLLTSLPMSVVRHRLYLLIGAVWQLRDIRSA